MQSYGGVWVASTHLERVRLQQRLAVGGGGVARTQRRLAGGAVHAHPNAVHQTFALGVVVPLPRAALAVQLQRAGQVLPRPVLILKLGLELNKTNQQFCFQF